DVEFYPFVLENLDPDDVVLDLGAGDLRLDILMAERVKKVYAVEVNPILLGRALQIIGYDLPRNLIVICANLFDVEIPKDATVVVILMRHCTRREEIFKRFKKLKIITNFGGELIIKDKRD
ncbi:MAG: class I SAM-dependent methyltransferase, partial [Candidatus Bathyarchaeia archaeon]